jgi:methylmalonyl-CoA/ethylmalonyl-CoA epimerase
VKVANFHKPEDQQENDMSKIRHIAIAVPNPEEAARFYMKALGLQRVGETHSDLADGVYLTDGYINLAFLNYRTDEAAGKERGKSYVGVHHFGVQVDDLEASGKLIETHGGHFFMDLPMDPNSVDYEAKYRDPHGIIFDISHRGWSVGKRYGDALRKSPA